MDRLHAVLRIIQICVSYTSCRFDKYKNAIGIFVFHVLQIIRMHTATIIKNKFYVFTGRAYYLYYGFHPQYKSYSLGGAPPKTPDLAKFDS